MFVKCLLCEMRGSLSVSQDSKAKEEKKKKQKEKSKYKHSFHQDFLFVPLLKGSWYWCHQVVNIFVQHIYWIVTQHWIVVHINEYIHHSICFIMFSLHMPSSISMVAFFSSSSLHCVSFYYYMCCNKQTSVNFLFTIMTIWV